MRYWVYIRRLILTPIAPNRFASDFNYQMWSSTTQQARIHLVALRAAGVLHPLLRKAPDSTLAYFLFHPKPTP